MDYETAARYAARAELARLRQSAAQRRHHVVGRIIGVEVTVYENGSCDPALDAVIRSHMAKRAKKENAR